MKTATKAAEVQGTESAKTSNVKPEISNVVVTPRAEEPKAQTKVLTVEDRKGRTEVWNKLLEKHENLKDVQKRVEAFAIGSDENSQTLSFKDSKGNLFNTGNPVLLKDVITLIRAQVTSQVGVVEDEVLNFII